MRQVNTEFIIIIRDSKLNIMTTSGYFGAWDWETIMETVSAHKYFIKKDLVVRDSVGWDCI